MRSPDGQFEEPDDQQRLTDEREDADGQRVAGNEDRPQRVGQVADARDGHEGPEDLREVDGLEQQNAKANEMEAEDRERQVPAIVERGDR